MRRTIAIMLLASSALVATGTTATPTTRKLGDWVKVAHRVIFYDSNTPKELQRSLRGDIDEFDIFGNPPTYPRGMSAADFEGLKEEHDRFDTS